MPSNGHAPALMLVGATGHWTATRCNLRSTTATTSGARRARSWIVDHVGAGARTSTPAGGSAGAGGERRFGRASPNPRHVDSAPTGAEVSVDGKVVGVTPWEGRLPPGKHRIVITKGAGRLVGRVSVRHELTDSLRNCGGHVGFGVVASARRRGYGTAILRQTLPFARSRGLARLLITCDEHNLGSRTIIETCGGVLEDTRPRPGGGTTRRYWIDL